MNKSPGFTLVELMVVIAVIAVLSAVAVPNYITYRNNQQVVRAARQVYSDLQSARMTAVRDNAAIKASFTAGKGDSGAYQVFEDLDNDDNFDSGDREIASGSMPPGVAIAHVNFTDNITEFNHLGLATGNSGSVTISNNSKNLRVAVGSGGSVALD